MRGITAEQTKFHYVVAALDGQTARRVGDLLRTPPADEYTALKKRLLSTFSLSERERASRLLDLEDLGDRKPSALMDHILALASSGDLSFLLRELFIRKLPESIRAIVAASSSTDLRTLAAEADTHFSSTGALISSITDTPSTESALIREEVNAAYRPRYPNSRFQQRNRQSTSKDYCYYHDTFGASAKKCRPPCSWGNDRASCRQ